MIGADIYFRYSEKNLFQGFLLQSFSLSENGEKTAKGLAGILVYKYKTKSLELDFGLEHVDDDFRMDTAFLNRVGFTRVRAYARHKFFPKFEKLTWIKSISSGFFAYYLYDTFSNLDDIWINLGLLDFVFTKQGYFSLWYYLVREGWANRSFNQTWLELRGTAQITKSLFFYALLRYGDRIYYDPIDPFLGGGMAFTATVSIQPSDKLRQDFIYHYEYLNQKSDDDRVYDIHILNSRTTYQFNKYFFMRAALRYDSYRDVLLTDFLASFTLIPGTVIHLGYGSLFEKRRWQEDRWVEGVGSMYEMRHSIFFKASYLWRF